MFRVEDEYSPAQLKGIIGQCDFFAGSRLHACIAALSQGIPTVGIAYSDKFAGVFAAVGATDAVVDARAGTAEEMLKACSEAFSTREKSAGRVKTGAARALAELEEAFGRVLTETRPARASEQPRREPE